jgi:hypothetical protein
MPTPVQHRTTFSNGTTSVALPFSSNNAAGNTLAYASSAGIGTVGVSMQIATDNNSNTIANGVDLASSGASGNGAARWDYVASSNSGANTVTAHAPSTFDIHLHIWELSGCATSSPVRASGSTHSATGSVSTSTSTPLSGDAVLAYFYDNPANDALTIGSGYTTSDISSNTTGLDSALSEYKTATGNGTQTATCTGNGTNSLDQVIVVFIQGASAPTLSTISPRSGTVAGGTSVDLTGTNFISGATISFGGTLGTSVSVNSSTDITCNAPAGLVGTVDVTVTTSAGSATLSSAYTYWQLATQSTRNVGIWSKDAVLAVGVFDIGIPTSFGLYDDDFVAQFSGTAAPVFHDEMIGSVPWGVFDRKATLLGLYGAI